VQQGSVNYSRFESRYRSDSLLSASAGGLGQSEGVVPLGVGSLDVYGKEPLSM